VNFQKLDNFHGKT